MQQVVEIILLTLASISGFYIGWKITVYLTKIKQIKLKHERLQYYIGRLLKINRGIDLYQLETDIIRDRVLEYNDQKRLSRLCGLKKSEIYYIRSKKEKI